MIIDHFGRDHVQSYIRHFYPNADLDELTKMQTQKIITDLYSKLPRKSITGIVYDMED